jgi:hypothetical protein
MYALGDNVAALEQLRQSYPAPKPSGGGFSSLQFNSMLQEIFATVRLFDKLPTVWPRGLRAYRPQDAIFVIDKLLTLKIAIANQILEHEKDIRQVIFNHEQWNRIAMGLNRAQDLLVPDMKKALAARKAGKTSVDLPNLRDNTIKMVIELKSAYFVIPELAKNIPSLAGFILAALFTITGMKMRDVLAGGFELLIDGAGLIAGLALEAGKRLADWIIPDWVVPAALGVAFYWFVIRK